MAENKTVVIKKYPNRRLYNTQTSKYITLDDLSSMLKDNQDFRVLDVKTGEDVTKIILAQIILEHETKGYSLLTEDFLKHIIKFYDHPLSVVFSNVMIDALKRFNHGVEGFKPLFEPRNLIDETLNWQKMIQDLGEQNSLMMNDMLKSLFPYNSKKDKK